MEFLVKGNVGSVVPMLDCTCREAAKCGTDCGTNKPRKG